MRLTPLLTLAAIAFALACNNGDDPPPPTPATETAQATAAPSAADADQPEPAGSVPFIPEEGLATVEIVERLAPAIVRVQTEGASIDIFGRTTPGGGVGTGVIIDTAGHIITNNHVVTVGDLNTPATSVTVTLSDQRTADAVIVGRDPPTDLAVLKIDLPDLQAAPLGDPGNLRVGQDVVAIGFALDLSGGPTVTRGVLSAVHRTIEEPPYTINDAIQTDAGINPGNSGGPLVNARGEVIGINTAIIRGAQNIGFAISVGLFAPTVEQLIAGGSIERAYLGVGTVDVTPSIAQNFDLPVESGIAVTIVGDGTPAEAAGLRLNDVIVKVDGEDVANNGDLLSVLARRRAGDVVEVQFYRGSEPQTVNVTLAARPAGGG
jgi:S1-C subfamily serine protease